MPKLINLPAVLVGVVIAILVGLGGGAWIMHAVDNGAYRALELRVSAAQASAKEAADKRLAADQAAAQAIAARDAADNRVAQATFNQIRKDSSYVEKVVRAQGVPAHILPAGWVRQYNAGLSAGAGQAPAPAGGTAAAPSGAGAVESAESLAAPSGINEWDVLDNATDNAEGYAKCRRQLNGLIDWAEATSD